MNRYSLLVVILLHICGEAFGEFSRVSGSFSVSASVKPHTYPTAPLNQNASDSGAFFWTKGDGLTSDTLGSGTFVNLTEEIPFSFNANSRGSATIFSIDEFGGTFGASGNTSHSFSRLSVPNGQEYYPSGPASGGAGGGISIERSADATGDSQITVIWKSGGNISRSGSVVGGFASSSGVSASVHSKLPRASETRVFINRGGSVELGNTQPQDGTRRESFAASNRWSSLITPGERLRFNISAVSGGGSPTTFPSSSIQGGANFVFWTVWGDAASETSALSSESTAQLISSVNITSTLGALDTTWSAPDIEGHQFQDHKNALWSTGEAGLGVYFETTDDSKFTHLLGFSELVEQSVRVVAEGQDLGTFSNGDIVDFAALLGRDDAEDPLFGVGVSSFAILGLNEDVGELPVQLAFDAETASFARFALDAVGLIDGDYDGSGSVEQGDLDLVLGNWGRNTLSGALGGEGVPAGWVNGLPSGAVDQGELDGVLTNWGSSSSPSLNGLTVPEPAGAFLVAVCLTVLSRRRID